MKWTREMLELVPQFCLRCENRVKKIKPSRLVLQNMVVVQCGHCGYILAKWDTRVGVTHGNQT